MANGGVLDQAKPNVHIDDSQTWVESKRYTVYKLVVKSASMCYFVFHRYNDFYQLYEKLKKDFPDSGLKLPGKRLIGNNFDPEFIKARQEGLNEFIAKESFILFSLNLHLSLFPKMCSGLSRILLQQILGIRL